LQFALRSLRELEGLVIFNSEAEELKYEKCKQHLSIAEAIGFGRYRVDVVLATPNVFLSLLKWGHVAVYDFSRVFSVQFEDVIPWLDEISDAIESISS